MKITFRILIVATAVGLAGCAATVVKTPAGGSSTSMRIPVESASRIVLNVSGVPEITRSSDWQRLRSDWSSAVFGQASTAQIPLAVQEGPPKPTGETGTLLAVTVKDYRYVSTGARIGLGIMTGNAFVDANVKFINLKTGELFGEQQINTSSSAWQGVFSALLDDQLKAIAKELVDDVKAR